jgi:hypothetical protein
MKISRRNFLKGTAVAAVATGLPAVIAAEPAKADLSKCTEIYASTYIADCDLFRLGRMPGPAEIQNDPEVAFALQGTQKVLERRAREMGRRIVADSWQINYEADRMAHLVVHTAYVG